MQVQVAFTVLGDVPDNVKVGDELQIAGRVTIHTIHSDLVDVSSIEGRAYLPSTHEVGVYANEITFAAVREP